MNKIKTHTFRLGKYKIIQINEPIYGVCDIPDEDDNLEMMIPAGNDLNSLQTALHEAMHADGIKDKYIHNEDGSCDVGRLARCLWRLGWRQKL